ncbi:MAG TPA: phospholipase D-like domain-containing protein, partial [Opitutales bacterium]|nr:phospholipase D-like domain-containing protein [Opitutales bacterium]
MSLPHPPRAGHGKHPAAPATASHFHWLKTGAHALAEMLAAIAHAKENIRLEMYIIQPDAQGEKFRDALTAAARRGVRVRVLADAFGSMYLKPDFGHALIAAGVEFRYFNLPGEGRSALRDHRKLMICDDARAFVGGLNIGGEYAGDGVAAGWRDLGLEFQGTLAGELGRAFDEMFELAEFRHPRFAWLRHAIRQRRLEAES